jgi:hypothetical protein
MASEPMKPDEVVYRPTRQERDMIRGFQHAVGKG